MIAIVAVIGFLYLVRGRHNFDEPPYQITRKEQNIEIREYSGYAVAEITISAEFDQATSQSFRPLFEYISGNNLGSKDLEMTAPVLVEPAPQKIEMTVPVLVEPNRGSASDTTHSLAAEEIDTWTVAFVLPHRYRGETAPSPRDSRIAIRDVAPRTVASIRFNGRFGNKQAEVHRQELAGWLQSQGLEHLGDWRVAAYDAPMTPPVLRRNEVLVTLS